jgi:hypothetical protein
MKTLHPFEIPEQFIRRFKPVTVSTRDKGIFRYLFDGHSLRFFQASTTCQPVPLDAIWSITEGMGQDILIRPGQWSDAIGFVVTDVIAVDDQCYPLVRRLSYRQKVQRSTLLGLIRDLSDAPLAIPAELRDWLEQRTALIGT